jgi:hypothetical protein
MAERVPPQNTVASAMNLAPGTVEVLVRDADSRAVPNQNVELAVEHHDVAEGDSTSRRVVRSDAEGKALFADVPVGTAYSFGVTIERDGAHFRSEEFRLAEGEAKRAVLHVFPVVREINRALVGMRAIVFVQPREDVFRVDVSYQVFNIGRSAWLPSETKVELPADAEAFRAPDGQSDLRLEQVGRFARLTGTVAPGQQEVGYGFQLESDNSDTRAFRLALLPHVAEIRVVVEGGRNVDLDVEGFPEAQRTRGQAGVPLLVTGMQSTRGQAPLDKVAFVISGLPTPSQGRWYAVGMAVTIAFAGLWTARPGASAKPAPLSTDDAVEAKRVLLDELVLLEQLRARDSVGPRTYENTRRALLDALARLDLHASTGATESGISGPVSAGSAE